jgi:hypothetical protein
MNTTLQVADDALDLIGANHDHIAWLSTLMTAIPGDAQHNGGLNVDCFTGLDEHVATDWNNYLDDQSETLRRHPDEHSARVTGEAL